MFDIFVQRGAGDLRGLDIVDPLILELGVGLARGRTELDSHSVLQQTVRIGVMFRTGIRLGQLAEVHDSLQGVSWKGKITGISHKIENGKVTTMLDVLRPAVFF
jgi:hypothetical protein